MDKLVQMAWGATIPGSELTGRWLAAAALRALARALMHFARRLAADRGRITQRMPELEFYRESGAPEGALYADGHYVGRLPGVTRL